VLAVVLLVWSPFLHSPRVDDRYGDWDAFSDYFAYTLHALFHDHQFPFWVTDPRFEQLRVKGLHDFFANPETGVLSIVTPLAQLWGLLTAVKIALVAYLALGVYGCRRLLRALGGQGGFLSLLLTALLALCNGALAAHVLVSHVNALAVASFPLALAWLLEALDPRLAAAERRFHAALAGALLAGAFYSGTTHYLLYFLIGFVGLLPLFTLLLAPKNWRVTLAAPAWVGGSFVALTAFKLLPGLFDLRGYRADYNMSYSSVRALTSNLVTPWAPAFDANSHEMSVYVGWAGAALLGLALLGVLDKRCRPLLLACLASGGLMFLGPGNPLLRLPLLRTQGVLTRPRLTVLIALAVIAVTQLERLVTGLRRSPRRSLRLGTVAVLAGLSLYLAVDLSRQNIARHVELGCLNTPAERQGPFDVAPILVPSDAQGTSVADGAVTANEFSYSFSRPGLTAPTMLKTSVLLREGRLPHLYLRGAGQLTTKDGALAVRVTGEKGSFTLYYSDPLVWWGLLSSLLAVAALMALGQASLRSAR
jgi:hypothetical protein